MSDVTPPPPPSQPEAAPAYGYAPSSSDRFNTLAIVGFILTFIVTIAGLIVSIIALNQIKRTGERGRALALWGVILSIVFMVLGILLGVIVAIASAHIAATGSAG